MVTRKERPALLRGDLVQITKLTKLLRLNGGKGFSYDYVIAVLNPNDARKNADILAIAQRMVADRQRSMEALIKQQRKPTHK